MKDDVQTLHIPLKQIYISATFNYRQTLPEVEAIAGSLKDRGQKQPIVVRPRDASEPGADKQPYALVIGARRCAGAEMNGWKEIRAEVATYKAGDVLGPAIDNWASNEEAKSTTPLEQAEFVHNLIHGYPLEDGTTAPTMTTDEVAKRLNVTTGHVHKLVKVFTNIEPEVQAAARKVAKKVGEHVPMRVLFALSNVQADEGIKDKDAKAESRQKNQTKALDSYLEKKEELAASGRTRKERKDAGNKKGKGGKKDTDAKPLVNPNRVLDETGNTPAYFLSVLLHKFAACETEEERAKIKLQLDTTRYFTGEISKFPGVTKADMTAHDKALEATEEVEEEEVEEAPKKKGKPKAKSKRRTAAAEASADAEE